MTLRALRVLGEADLLLAEDTRRTRVLLERHRIEARPRSLHAHNEAARTGEVLERLSEGAQVALVSDAGTPLISDPGERLVAAVVEAGFDVVPVPGASAVLAALSVSGLPTQPFTMLGFLPRKAGARDALLERFRASSETLVLFESPRRLPQTLRRLAELLGPRRACVARELTKLHEEVARGDLAQLAQRYAEGARGEVTVVVAGAEASAADTAPEVLDAEIRARLAAGEPSKQIASALSGRGLARREIYARVLALREAAD